MAIFWGLRAESRLPLSHKRGLLALTSAAMSVFSKSLFQEAEPEKVFRDKGSWQTLSIHSLVSWRILEHPCRPSGSWIQARGPRRPETMWTPKWRPLGAQPQDGLMSSAVTPPQGTKPVEFLPLTSNTDPSVSPVVAFTTALSLSPWSGFPPPTVFSCYGIFKTSVHWLIYF